MATTGKDSRKATAAAMKAQKKDAEAALALKEGKENSKSGSKRPAEVIEAADALQPQPKQKKVVAADSVEPKAPQATKAAKKGGEKDSSEGEKEGDEPAPKAAAAKKQKREAKDTPKQEPKGKKSKKDAVAEQADKAEAAPKAGKAKGEAKKASKKQPEADKAEAEEEQQEEVVAEQRTSRAGRKTQPVNYKDSGKNIAGQAVAIKEEAEAESEAAAIEQLASGSGPFRLLDFEVFDDSNEPQPLDRVKHHNGPLWISGVLHPLTGAIKKEAGRRVARFGPVLAWGIEQQGAAVQIALKTPKASYVCTRPATSYRKIFTHLTEQADIAFEVQKVLNPKVGGKADASLEEVVARLSRAKVGKSYSSAREALFLNGTFVVEYLKEVDGKSGGTLGLAETPVASAILQEVSAMQAGGGTRNGAIVINEGAAAAPSAAEAGLSSAEKRSLQADSDYARQLQAKMDAQESRAANKRGGGRGAAYIKISEAEIADDYPEPTQYDKVEDETDELLLADDELFDVDPEALPRSLLSDFSVYNSEGMMSTLELLPMWGGAEPDVELFFSGNVVADDGEWAGGQSLEENEAAGGSSSGAGGSSSGAGGSSSGAGGSSSGAGGSSGAAGGEGAHMRIYSSQIQEWLVEFSCDRLFITIRTDVAWYRLAEPAAKYKPWFDVVLKSARLAVKTLTLLSEESRASKLSFTDILKRLAATDEADPTFISKKVDKVQRFVVVHAQILLNQYKNFPVKAVRESAFASGLKAQMELRRHAKLYSRPAKQAKGKARSNSNPMRDRASVRAAPMTATATSMVRSIWQSYFPSNAAATADEAAGATEAVEVEEDLNEEDDEGEVENALAEAAAEAPTASADMEAEVAVEWKGASTRKAAGKTFYKSATAGETEFSVGDVVTFSGASDVGALGIVQALWQDNKGEKSMQVRSVLRGAETVLGDAASKDELFVTAKLLTRPVNSVTTRLTAIRQVRGWKLTDRRTHITEDLARQERNATAAAASQPLEYFYRSLYLPEQGMFCQLPESLNLGHIAEEEKKLAEGVSLTPDGEGLLIDGVEYRAGDFVFLRPGVLDQVEGAGGEAVELPEYLAKGRFHKGGANAGLRPYGIAQLVQLAAADGKKKAKKGSVPSKVEVRRFYRPEDISQQQAYQADFWDVYASSEKLDVEVSSIVSKCSVSLEEQPDVFVCRKTFNRQDSSFADPPAELGQQGKKGKAAASAAGKKAVADKGKTVAAKKSDSTTPVDSISLASMDIFAGCGGLTEGLHQAGAAHAKWAIEYEEPAAEAFRLNHPDAVCWAKNCNVILTAAMHKAGMADICAGSSQAEDQAKQLDEATLASIPAPGEVEFLCGGPPCQGYSGMNRFNKGNWSMVQNSMVMAYLSFADFYRPRYFLLENVRNFVSHNKSFTFRLTLRSLLDMGYQVRFGVLNAGNFGVSQSRKRTFIWAAAPGEALPDWPRLLHIFKSPQLTINLPGNVKYSAVPQTEGAPLRTVTVKDVISDLPPIQNGHSEIESQYSGPAVSAFQKRIRGEQTVLKDHICKEMNGLNLERCRCIPKEQPGADWRVLQQIVEKDPAREKFQGQPLVPWCLPNTADRHNGWRGLFGRLDWGGHFPTSTTDPQPMGKVGQVFHPSQDRIVSVRECARAQGFPDSFSFYGNVHMKHRQIGNAVPPPLAFNLGKCLRKALEKTAAKKSSSILEAQMGI